MTPIHDCPEEVDLPCGICTRAVDAYEAEREAPTGYDDGMADLLADRYERTYLDREMS